MAHELLWVLGQIPFLLRGGRGVLPWKPWSGEGDVLRTHRRVFPVPPTGKLASSPKASIPTSPVSGGCFAFSVPSDSNEYVLGKKVIPGVPNPMSLASLSSIGGGTRL